MNDPTFNATQAHKTFGPTINHETWDLMEKKDRSPEESERMIYAAHTSCYHWLKVGGKVNHQRGEWMIARVYTILGRVSESIRHAKRCLELTTAHPEEMKDFDWAFAYECMARAHALAGDQEDARVFRAKAQAASETITDPEDRKAFQLEFNNYEWYGALENS